MGAVSNSTTPLGGSVMFSSAVSVPPWAHRSAISASGSPGCRRPVSASRRYVRASPASGPAPADTIDGICEIVCAATPLKRARASSPDSARHAGVPCSINRGASRIAAEQVGRDRALVPEQHLEHAVVVFHQRRPSSRRHGHRRPTRHTCGPGRGSRSRPAAPAAGCRRRSRGPAASHRGRQIELGEKRRRQCQRMHRRADVVGRLVGVPGPGRCGLRRRAWVGPRTPAPPDRPGRR